MCTRDEETKWSQEGFKCIIGCDEAGAGTLAGPVTVCACHVPLTVTIPGINDSKKLTPKKRDQLYELIVKCPEIKYSIVHIAHDVIDEINILQARFEGFYRAYTNLKKELPQIDAVFIDGDKTPPQFKSEQVKVHTIVKGDASCVSIAIASILAKVTRDRMMVEYEKQYPGYEFAVHKGYHTPQHVELIRKLGPCEIHRKTFRGVKQETDDLNLQNDMI